MYFVIFIGSLACMFIGSLTWGHVWGERIFSLGFYGIIGLVIWLFVELAWRVLWFIA